MPRTATDDAFDSTRFAQVVSDQICSYQFDAQGSRVPGSARMSGINLDPLNLVLYEGRGAQWGDRRRDHISVDRADYFVLSMPLSARLDIVQDGAQTRLFPGSFAFVATSRPSQAFIHGLGENEAFRSLHLRIPGPMLRERLPDIDQVCNREIGLNRGAGVVMRAMLESVAVEAPYFDPAQTRALAPAMFDTICSVAVPAAAAMTGQRPARVPASTHTFLRAKAYIEAHLSDAELSVDQIAEHCRVSSRGLHAAFANASLTVCGWIRERRLQGCRAALRSPSMRGRAILAIASDWGFDDPAHFSHLYKTRFGLSPRQERALNL